MAEERDNVLKVRACSGTYTWKHVMPCLARRWYSAGTAHAAAEEGMPFSNAMLKSSKAGMLGEDATDRIREACHCLRAMSRGSMPVLHPA